MRVLLTVDARNPVPLEMMPMLLQGFLEWRQRYEEHATFRRDYNNSLLPFSAVTGRGLRTQTHAQHLFPLKIVLACP